MGVSTQVRSASEVGTDLRAVRRCGGSAKWRSMPAVVYVCGGPAQWRSMSAVVRLCGGPCLWRSMPADAALSEKSPHLGSAQVRLSLSKNPKVQPEDLRGRDRSPSGPHPQKMAFFQRNRPIYGVFACEFCVRIQRCEDFLPVTPSSKSKNASDIKVIKVT